MWRMPCCMLSGRVQGMDSDDSSQLQVAISSQSSPTSVPQICFSHVSGETAPGMVLLRQVRGSCMWRMPCCMLLGHMQGADTGQDSYLGETPASCHLGLTPHRLQTGSQEAAPGKVLLRQLRGSCMWRMPCCMLSGR